MDRSEAKRAINAHLREVIEEALAVQGMSARAASEAVVGHDGLIRDIKRGNVPTADKLAKLAEVLGLDFYFGPTRLNDDFRLAALGMPDERARSLIASMPGRGFHADSALSQYASDESFKEYGDEFVKIPLHDVELAAGEGALVDFESIGGYLMFRRDWMRRLDLAPRNARLARVRGDSMVPMLFDRDVVLIDMSRTSVPVSLRTKPHASRTSPRTTGGDVRTSDQAKATRRHLVAIEQGGEARVKWAERPTSDVMMIYSENSALFRPEVYVGAELNDIRIIGGVVWWCHTVSD